MHVLLCSFVRMFSVWWELRRYGASEGSDVLQPQQQHQRLVSARDVQEPRCRGGCHGLLSSKDTASPWHWHGISSVWTFVSWKQNRDWSELYIAGFQASHLNSSICYNVVWDPVQWDKLSHQSVTKSIICGWKHTKIDFYARILL